MRKSADKNDPGYDLNVSRFEVFLNGEKLKFCITADEKLGCAWIYKTYSTGEFVLTESGDEVEQEVVFGKVEIRENK